MPTKPAAPVVPVTVVPHVDVSQPLHVAVDTVPGQQQAYTVQVIKTPETHKDAYDTAGVYMNGVLAVVGIVGIVIAVKTLCKVGKQTTEMGLQRKAMQDTLTAIETQGAHMERQAKEMSYQNRNMVKAERAWLVVEVTQPKRGTYAFTCKNVGKTPANVLSAWTGARYYDRNSQFEFPSDELTEASQMNFAPGLLPPGASRYLLMCSDKEFQTQSGGGEGEDSNFSKGFGEAYIFGRIRYENVLSGERKIHETRFAYWHIAVPGWTPSQSPYQREFNTFT